MEPDLPATERRTTDRRFLGVARLYGEAGAARLAAARAAVIGLGGVGSWAAEALARTGIGSLTLVDLDDICESNINRQIHALDDTVGRTKTGVMRERIAAISPDCAVDSHEAFFTRTNGAAFLDEGFDAIVDAIDSVPHKAFLVAECRRRNIPLVCAGGAGGKRRPEDVRVEDLGRAYNDPLLARLRKILRREYGFPKAERARFRVACVFSPELPVDPRQAASGCAPGPADGSMKLDCATGYGAAAFVTGTFGFLAAGWVANRLAAPPAPERSGGAHG
ncbi:MAG: tRNA threonylcarbamoyladenosine dehydratase [Opitutales bacterium]|nr:tRNA threonylcarbamoyladenosine dehydratase [Opitutales bacterium]